MKQLMMLNLVVFVACSAHSQNTLSPVSEPLAERKAISSETDFMPYPKIRQADIMWSKIVWQKIDLREKINQPLYYPIENYYDPENYLIPSDNRFNITALLIFEYLGEKGNVDLITKKYPADYPNSNGIAKIQHILDVEKELMACGNSFQCINNNSASSKTQLNYYVYEDHEFKKPKSLSQIWDDLGGGMDSTVKINQYGEEEFDAHGRAIYDYYRKSIRLDEVVELQIKEIWYFDKNRGKMEVRIAGICPVRKYFDELTQKNIRIEIGWFYFPAVRKTLATHEVFNFVNQNERKSFDDIFVKRFFTSIIYAESNVYDNREIREYKMGQDALEESERIKKWIFEFEHDLWEY
ncbi:MAG: gliding motility protein GldN [Bacteroidales bacterium]|nr:gliding motility protein GldN [Bacteroidales bacterium]